jgi:hypothetical protein
MFTNVLTLFTFSKSRSLESRLFTFGKKRSYINLSYFLLNTSEKNNFFFFFFCFVLVKKGGKEKRVNKYLPPDPKTLGKSKEKPIKYRICFTLKPCELVVWIGSK